MPSLIEALGIVGISTAIDLSDLTSEMMKRYQTALKQYKVAIAPKSFIAFIIPLDTFIPLSERYSADILKPSEEGFEEAYLTMVTSIPISVNVADNPIKVRLTIMCVAVGDVSTTTKTIHEQKENLSRLYQEAIERVNKVILGYKVTPFRHNHDLRTVTALNRPSSVRVLRINGITGEILEQESIFMHDYLTRSLMNAKSLTEKEKRSFQFAHVSFSRDQVFAANIVQKIYEAIDARCLGDNTYAVVLADAYVEHVMRYILFRCLQQEGSPDDQAHKELEGIRMMEKLVSRLAQALGTNKSHLKEEVGFTKWNANCRLLRNGITHNFLGGVIDGESSFNAIGDSVNLAIKLTSLAVIKYPLFNDDMQWFSSLQWYIKMTDSSKQQIDDAANGKQDDR